MAAISRLYGDAFVRHELHVYQGQPECGTACEPATGTPVLLPTLPNCTSGIVGWDPLRLQCSACGVIHEQCQAKPNLCLITCGFHFHVCDGRSGRRLCPDCLRTATGHAGCPQGGAS